jgi:archaellum component FlaC
MTTVAETLNEIREELRELRALYKGLVEKLIPIEEASEDERRAIEEPDDIASEEELLKALGGRNVHR